jgi:hypothetical protein
MSGRPAALGVAVLLPDGQGNLTAFDTYSDAVEFADHALLENSSNRAWIIRRGKGEVELLGVRGTGVESYDRIRRFHIAPQGGGTMTPFDTYEEAREHAEALMASRPDSPGMVIFSLEPSGRVTVEQVSPPGR